jgi:hypothetical protein
MGVICGGSDVIHKHTCSIRFFFVVFHVKSVGSCSSQGTGRGADVMLVLFEFDEILRTK